jgi:hypothetical protein
MVDRLRIAVKDLKQEVDVANVRLMTIGKCTVYIMRQLEEMQERLNRKNDVQDSDADAGPPKKQKIINAVHESKFDSGSLVLPGLFNGEWEGERCDGDKGSAVFFRLLCKNIYPEKDKILQEFLLARCDVHENAVRKWFKLNDSGLVLRLRSRRSVL